MEQALVVTTISPARSPSASISFAIVKEATAAGQAVADKKAVISIGLNCRKCAVTSRKRGNKINFTIFADNKYFQCFLTLLISKLPPNTINAKGVATFAKLEIVASKIAGI